MKIGVSYLKIFSTLLLASLFVVVFDQDLRSSVRTYVLRPHRTILAVAHGDLDHSGKQYQILKVKNQDGLYLEVYGPDQKLLSVAKLPNNKDGYFTIGGEVTNLALDDIDNDQRPEILATSFDRDLVAHLEVYKYIPGQKELQAVPLQ